MNPKVPPEETKDANVGPDSRVPLGFLVTIIASLFSLFVTIVLSVVAGLDRLKAIDDANKERTQVLSAQVQDLSVTVDGLRTELRGSISQDRFRIYMLEFQQLNPGTKLPQ